MQSHTLILSATASEQQSLRQQLSCVEVSNQSCRTLTKGILLDRPVSLLGTGLGTVNTSQALTAAILNERPGLVIQIGIGGAYLGSGLTIGDIALADEEIYGDLGVLTPDGWESIETIGIPVLAKGQDYYNRFPLDAHLVKHAECALEEVKWDIPETGIKVGTFITVQQCSGTTETGKQLESRFNGICENMEGAAAAHVCRLYEIPFLEVRAISNLVVDRNKDEWDIPLALKHSQTAACKLVEKIGR